MFSYVFIICLSDHSLTDTHTPNLEMLSHLKKKVPMEPREGLRYPKPKRGPLIHEKNFVFQN